MIPGAVNGNLEATVRLVVRGSGGQEQEIEAVIDTGFNGFLTLSPALVEAAWPAAYWTESCAAGQWEPVLHHLQAHHCTIVLGGPSLKPVEQLESRAEGGYTRMALQLLDLAKPHAGEALIEVGCGTGALLRRIVRHTGMAQVTGLDINGFLLKEAHALAVQEGLEDRLIFEQGSAEAVPFPDNAFDIVYSCRRMEEGMQTGCWRS